MVPGFYFSFFVGGVWLLFLCKFCFLGLLSSDDYNVVGFEQCDKLFGTKCFQILVTLGAISVFVVSN